MSTNFQLLKGLMDGVILKIISNKETYGYEIYETLQELGFTEFAEGSLYPLLLRLEKKNKLRVLRDPPPFRPDRKYYSLTPEGLEEMDSFKTSWDKINSAVSKL